jgi:alginate production protein
MREFWVGYSGLTPYPGEILRLGRQRLRNDDGQWRDTNIEAVNWTFDTTLLRANAGVAERFSEYRTDLKELAPKDKDRLHAYAEAAYQWTPGQWVGIRGHHTHDDGKLDYANRAPRDALDKNQNGDISWLGLTANSDAYNWRNTNTVNYWGSVTWHERRPRHGQAAERRWQRPAQPKQSGDVNGWATDLACACASIRNGRSVRPTPAASADYEQNGLKATAPTTPAPARACTVSARPSVAK